MNKIRLLRSSKAISKKVNFKVSVLFRATILIELFKTKELSL